MKRYDNRFQAVAGQISSAIESVESATRGGQAADASFAWRLLMTLSHSAGALAMCPARLRTTQRQIVLGSLEGSVKALADARAANRGSITDELGQVRGALLIAYGALGERSPDAL